ncbi:hypothetical protein [Vibrio crassostreae]|uniref:hypothetical protein n=1 Tax=Vibrio crassostreae TaxID=246167 RepID=UPI002E16EE49|nr:hypothetical protein [Vibrio crassostreae]
MKNLRMKNATSRIITELSNLSIVEAEMVVKHVGKELFRNWVMPEAPTRRLSIIESDREVYEFLLSLDLEFMTQRDVFDVCVDKFGEERMPKKSSFNRGFRKLLAHKQLREE